MILDKCTRYYARLRFALIQPFQELARLCKIWTTVVFKNNRIMKHAMKHEFLHINWSIHVANINWSRSSVLKDLVCMTDSRKASWEFNDWRVWQWASCQIRQIAGSHAPGMPGTFSPPPRVSNPDMHARIVNSRFYHGTCVTHVP